MRLTLCEAPKRVKQVVQFGNFNLHVACLGVEVGCFAQDYSQLFQ